MSYGSDEDQKAGRIAIGIVAALACSSILFVPLVTDLSLL